MGPSIKREAETQSVTMTTVAISTGKPACPACPSTPSPKLAFLDTEPRARSHLMPCMPHPVNPPLLWRTLRHQTGCRGQSFVRLRLRRRVTIASPCPFFIDLVLDKPLISLPFLVASLTGIYNVSRGGR